MTPGDFQALIAFLEETPEMVRQSTADLTEEARTGKPSDSEFSALEQVCHLRDIEQEGYAVRIDKLLTQDRPLLDDIDGSRLAVERNYNRESYGTALREFASARIENLKRLKAISPEQLESRGVLQGVGEITLGRLLELMREHDQSHRDELKGLRDRLSGRQVSGSFSHETAAP
jgi:hypothetical protein